MGIVFMLYMLLVNEWSDSRILALADWRCWVWIVDAALVLWIGMLLWRWRQMKRAAEQAIFQFFKDAVTQYDLKGNFISMNEANRELTGFDDCERKELSHEAWLPAEERAKANVCFQLAVRGRPQHFDTVCVRKDGARINIELSYIPALFGDRVHSIYGMMKDVTELKQNRELLLQSDKLAVVGELAAGIAHEIRNPLTSLRGFLQLCKERDNMPHADIMLAEIDRIHTITNELLMLGKPQSIEFIHRPLTPMLEAILTLIHTQALLFNITINVEIAKEAEEMSVLCDETRLKQVMLNILKNAMESMPDGGEMWVTLDRMQDFAVIRVKDTGCGISNDRLEQLGKAFYTSKESGTGLGLMVSYNIIEQHRGEIEIASELGRGTTVKIRLPLI